MTILAQFKNQEVEVLNSYTSGGVKYAGVKAITGKPFVGGDKWPIFTEWATAQSRPTGAAWLNRLAAPLGGASMTNEIIPTNPTPVDLAGQIANQIAGAGAFSDYRRRRAANTLNRQDNDLRLFVDFLGVIQWPGLHKPEGGTWTGADFAVDPKAWQGITWGLVAGFVRWLLAEGYAVSTVNITLTTIRVYAARAAQAGTLDPAELTLIKAVRGYGRSEGIHVDESRELTRRSSRRNGTRANKKAQSVTITSTQAAALKAQPDTPQGRRDRLLLCLLCDHGLRVGEVARLTVGDFDLTAGELHFYRPKVDKNQTHRLTPDTLAAARAYLANDAPALGPIWKGSRKGKGSKHDITGGGVLTDRGMTARAITQRVSDLGALLGIVGLSAHDMRHYWATQAALHGTPLERLKEAGGWSSLAMPERYIQAAKIANDGVKLS